MKSKTKNDFLFKVKAFLEKCLADRRIIALSLLVILGLIVLPFLIAAFYANPAMDDFVNFADVMRVEANSWISKSFIRTKECFFNWQGTYTGSFLVYYLSGLYNNGGMRALHVEYAFSILFFFFSLWIAVSRIINSIFAGVNEKIRSNCTYLMTFVVVVFSLIYNQRLGEIFYWHTGISVYTLPLSLGLISIGLVANEDVGIFRGLLACFFAFFSVGGALDISAGINAVLLLCTVYRFVMKNKWKGAFVCFIFAFGGALLNVCAPGNYVRHDGQLELSQAILNSVIGVLDRNIQFLFGLAIPFFLLLMIVMYNFVHKYMDKERIINPIIIAITFFVAEVIIEFPVYLGGYSLESFPPRCDFISRVFMIMFWVIWMIDFLGWLAFKYEAKILFNTQIRALLCLILFISLIPFFTKDNTAELFPFQIYKDLNSGELDKYEETNNLIISALENANGDDVKITIYDWSNVDYLMDIGLQADPNYWTNEMIRSYYPNAKSISVEYK